MMVRRWAVGLLSLGALGGCENGGEAQALAGSASSRPEARDDAATCALLGPGATLPDEVRETSGLAQSLRDSARFWTHNDAGNDPELFVIDAAGRLVQRVRIAGADVSDWEDIEAGQCASGTCLFIGDIGDNDAERDRITIYRLPEPANGARDSDRAIALHARYPDGPRDAESLFRLSSGDLYVVTKGRRGPVELYRFPAPQQPGETATLERVGELFPEPDDALDRVTAATASPDGRWVGVRTYRHLYFYRADDLTGGGAAQPSVVDLAPLGHAQGEAVAISPGGTVWLSTEAEDPEARPRWARLQCTLPAD